MKKMILAIALATSVAACGGGSADKGPTAEEMKAAASKLLQVREAKITEFTKGKCRSKDEGFVCDFEMYIAYGETPTKLDLNSGYFFESDDEWVMELVG